MHGQLSSGSSTLSSVIGFPVKSTVIHYFNMPLHRGVAFHLYLGSVDSEVFLFAMNTVLPDASFTARALLSLGQIQGGTLSPVHVLISCSTLVTVLKTDMENEGTRALAASCLHSSKS